MAWADSKISSNWLKDRIEDTDGTDFSGGTPKAALYNNTITPDQDATPANFAYNVDQWATAQEVYEAGQWAQGGVALTTPTVTVSAVNLVTLDAVDTASGTNADLASVYGVLVYDDAATTPVADQGICYNYLGGENSVVDGTFTVVWHTNGIARFTL